MAMTSRERVYKAIRHEEPDRVPVDIGGTYATGIHMDAYAQIARNLGLELDILPAKIPNQFMMIVKPDMLLSKWLGSDVIWLENIMQNWGLELKDWKNWTSNKGNPVLMPGGFAPTKDERGYYYINGADGKPVAYMAPDGEYFERHVETTFSEEIVYTDPKAYKDSLPNYKDEHLRMLEKRAKYLYEYTDYSIHGGFEPSSMFAAAKLAGHTFSDWLCLMVTDTDYIKSIVMAMAEWTLGNLKMYLQAVGKYIDTIMMSGADFGGQNSEIFSPNLFKTIYVPAYTMLNNYVHENSNVKTLFHSCGSNRNILKYFIEMGVDIFNPVQTSAAGMDPHELKKEFGKDLVFWGGGADTQGILRNGTPEEVRNQVKERIEAFGKGGGYVFTQVHNLQSDVPFENVEAMVKAAREFGNYPIK
jgi:uroporphyrinogen decarboxylase